MEWTGVRYADGPRVEVTTEVAASPEVVWPIITDVTLMPQMSEELLTVEWSDPTRRPTVGSSFVGTSRHPALGEWSTTSYVVEYDSPRRFTWAVSDPQDPSSSWGFVLADDDSLIEGGTRLMQWMTMGPAPSGLSLAIDAMPDKEQKIVFVRMREFEAGMTRTLADIKQRAEGAA